MTHLDSYDVLEIQDVAQKLVREVRRESAPRALVIETARLGTHSKGDDTRTEEEINLLWTLRDPVEFHGLFMGEQERWEIQKRVMSKIETAFEAALAMPGGRT